MESGNPKVCFLGPEGTYTHQALIQQFGNITNIIAEKTINDCFKRIENDEADYAVVPFENSTNGQVTFTYDLLRDRLIPAKDDDEHIESKIRIVAEQFVSIHHCFLTHAKSISEVEKIYSHPQAWGQITDWTNANAKNIEKIDTTSTSKAAEIAASSGPKVAAIASEYASKVHDLPILYENIENDHANTTRFLILSKKEQEVIKDKRYVSLLAFTVKHDDPGALVNVLNILATYGINLTSINSRPSLIKPWQYVFFIEFWGNANKDQTIKEALEEFETKTLNTTVIGTFPRSEKYFG